VKDDVFERIEMKIAYLERANNDLSDVVYRQQQELAALTERLAQLAGRLDAIKGEQGSSYTLEEERPPHY
jgi:SlyX protein